MRRGALWIALGVVLATPTVRATTRPEHLGLRNMGGARVSTLVSGWLDADRHEAAWDGRAEPGCEAARPRRASIS